MNKRFISYFLAFILSTPLSAFAGNHDVVSAVLTLMTDPPVKQAYFVSYIPGTCRSSDATYVSDRWISSSKDIEKLRLWLSQFVDKRCIKKHGIVITFITPLPIKLAPDAK